MSHYCGSHLSPPPSTSLLYCLPQRFCLTMSRGVHLSGPAMYTVGDVYGAATHRAASRGSMKTSELKLNAMFCSRCISREGQFVLSICSLLLISIACSSSVLTFQFSSIFFFFLPYPPLRVQKETFEPRVRSTSLNYEDTYLIAPLCFAPFNSVCSRYDLSLPPTSI
jgi:hypothetical protein